MTINRFSSRTHSLETEFLAKSLKGAVKYLRIAGYFRSSIFELIGEEISQIPEVKIVCNSELDIQDFLTAIGRERALQQQWNDIDVVSESMFRKERYEILDQLLNSGKVEIRVVPREKLFLHGKAGSVHYADGTRKAFMGSVNETKSAFKSNYELVWQDDDEASADWVEDEFWHLWEQGVPLPDTIIDEIKRIAQRREVSVEALAPKDLPAAAMVEAPLYRGGEGLKPWQRSFVSLFLEHREAYGKARLLLTDEVGIGKTLSMATSALVSALLDDGPILILAPSTLTTQWQIEMLDRLGVPSAVWSSHKKAWLDSKGRLLSPQKTPKSIKSCPCRIAIVSTGLIVHQRDDNHFIKEAEILLKRKYGTVILDEAHKARKKGGIHHTNDPNNLLAFMLEIAKKSKHVILGTATPIQTDVRELWDLMEVLSSGAEFVLGDTRSLWRDIERSIPILTGKKSVESELEAWNWLSNPLPPSKDSIVISSIRDDLEIGDKTFISSYNYEDLSPMTKGMHLSECLDSDFFVKHNPMIRHIVLRKRQRLEDLGLLEKIGVNTHPIKDQLYKYNSRFVGLGIQTNTPFQVAYEQAERFSQLLQSRTRSGGFMKSLMLQRICSSFASGRNTAVRMLEHSISNEEEDKVEDVEHILNDMSPAEINCLKEIKFQLSRPEAVDSKLDIVLWFLTEFKTEKKTWLEHGCIIFSQYYDTVEWIAYELSKRLGNEVVAVYAGLGKSGLHKDGKFNPIDREAIKSAVKRRDIRLVVATDAACEGLNLQTLGTLINVDLPWNPSRLEQRLGRIKRFGQARISVDMLNLVYSDTQDEKVYQVISERLKSSYDIFGSLPDTIDDEWIDNEEELKKRMDQYISERNKAQNAFSLKYDEVIEPDSDSWSKCATVLSRHDIVNKLSEPW